MWIGALGGRGNTIIELNGEPGAFKISPARGTNRGVALLILKLNAPRAMTFGVLNFQHGDCLCEYL